MIINLYDFFRDDACAILFFMGNFFRFNVLEKVFGGGGSIGFLDFQI